MATSSRSNEELSLPHSPSPSTPTPTNNEDSLSFLCSFICFVPWSQASSDESEEMSSATQFYDDAILDDDSVSSATSSLSSALSSSLVSYQAISDESNGGGSVGVGEAGSWSVFRSRRRNSGNAMKDLSDHSPIRTQKTNHSSQYFDIKGL
jgi:hypothetical protein